MALKERRGNIRKAIRLAKLKPLNNSLSVLRVVAYTDGQFVDCLTQSHLGQESNVVEVEPRVRLGVGTDGGVVDAGKIPVELGVEEARLQINLEGK